MLIKYNLSKSTQGLFAARSCFGVALVVFAALSATASAQPAATKAAQTVAVAQKKIVEVVLTQAKVVKAADGTEQLQDATSVKPGDVLEYRATYTNNTGKTVTGLVADLPIPEGLEYLPKSAKPGATLVKAAVKNGVFAAEPLTHKVGTKTEAVPYGDYRSLRWALGQLPADGVTAVSARAKVQIVVPPAPKASDAGPQAPPAGAAAAR